MFFYIYEIFTWDFLKKPAHYSLLVYMYSSLSICLSLYQYVYLSISIRYIYITRAWTVWGHSRHMTRMNCHEPSAWQQKAQLVPEKRQCIYTYIRTYIRTYMCVCVSNLYKVTIDRTVRSWSPANYRHQLNFHLLPWALCQQRAKRTFSSKVSLTIIVTLHDQYARAATWGNFR